MICRRLSLTTLLSGLIFVTCVHGQTGINFLSATTGGACQQTEYYVSGTGKFLFAGTGTTFRVYDLSAFNSQPPYPLVFEYRFRSFITDIQLHNEYLYIAANHDGVSKWDISNPFAPSLVWQYLPESLEEASHDLSFYGDSLLIASNKKVVMLHDQGNGFERVTEWGSAPGLGFISGGAVRAGLYAYTVGRTTSSDGVYLFNLKTMQQVSYYPQTFSDPENVVFGRNTPYLHVLGGTQNYTNPLDARGLFYTLDLTNPLQPELIYSDTISGFIGLAIANARIGININDTIYVVTTAGLGPEWAFPDPASGQVYVYDATGQQIKYLTDLYAGLWFFDIAIHDHNMFVASEWYGIMTVDISNIYDEQDLGDTPTGGWAMKADVKDGRLVIANEGYGFKLYDISAILSPTLTGFNTDPGFCQNVKFSPDGNYIFGLYQTYVPFRVFDATTMEQVGDLGLGGAVVSYGWNRMETYGNRVFLDCQEGTQQKLRIIDVSEPSGPALVSTLQTDVRDMEIDETGRLFICNDDSILVYDISGNHMSFMTGIALTGLQNGLELAAYKDTLFVFVSSKGLTRYILENDGLSWTLSEDVSIFLQYGVPQELAADSLGLYIGYTQFGVYMRNKESMIEVTNYRTGLDYKGFTTVWPLSDLFCRDGCIFVTEYFGQTSILTANPKINDVPEEINNTTGQIKIVPNPNHGSFSIECDGCNFSGPSELKVYDLEGQVVFCREVRPDGNKLSLLSSGLSLPAGVYVLSLSSGNNTQKVTGKFVIH